MAKSVSSASRAKPGYSLSRSSFAYYILIGFLFLYPVKIFLFKALFIYLAVLILLLLTLPGSSSPRYNFHIDRAFFWVSGIYLIPLVSLITTSYPDETKSALLASSVNLMLAFLSCWQLNCEAYKRVAKVVFTFPVVLFLTAIVIFLVFGSLRPSDRAMADVIGSFSNHASAICVLCIPYLVWAYKHKILNRVALKFAFISAATVILLSVSRAAIALFFLSLVLSYLKLSKRALDGVLKVVFICVVGALVLYFSYALWGESSSLGRVLSRFQESQIFSNESLSNPNSELNDYGRAAMYAEGIEMIKVYWPVGAGYGGLKPFMEERIGFGLVSHNIIITAVGELGIIGLAGYIAVFLGIYFQLRKIGRSNSHRTSDLGKASIVMLVTFILYSMSRPFEGVYIFPILIGFVLQLPRAPREESRRQFQVESPRSV